mgnify:CR=1 FL=1
MYCWVVRRLAPDGALGKPAALEDRTHEREERNCEQQIVAKNALKLEALMKVHSGVFIASLEYNASISPLLKNTLDWISRITGREPDATLELREGDVVVAYVTPEALEHAEAVLLAG